MTTSNNAQPTDVFFWWYVLEVVIFFTTLCWVYFQTSYFWQFRNDGSFVEKRRPLLSVAFVFLMWFGVSGRFVVHSFGMFPENWFYQHVITVPWVYIFLTNTHLLVGFFLIIRLWLCYFDFKRRLHLRDMEWTRHLQLRLEPWTIRYGHTLGSFKVLFTLAVGFYLLLMAFLIAFKKLFHNGHNNANGTVMKAATASVMLSMAFFCGLLYYKVHTFGDFWDIRNEVRLIVFWTVVIAIGAGVLQMLLPAQSKVAQTTSFDSFYLWSFCVTYVSISWVLSRKQIVSNVTRQSSAKSPRSSSAKKMHFLESAAIHGFCGRKGVLYSCFRSMASKRQWLLGCVSEEYISSDDRSANDKELDVGTPVVNPQLQRSTSNELKLLDVISVKNGFKAFCYHLCNEYALESMLFIIQLLQVKETIWTKRILSKDAIGYTIDLPAYVLQIHKHKSLARVTEEGSSKMEASVTNTATVTGIAEIRRRTGSKPLASTQLGTVTSETTSLAAPFAFREYLTEVVTTGGPEQFQRTDTAQSQTSQSLSSSPRIVLKNDHSDFVVAIDRGKDKTEKSTGIGEAVSGQRSDEAKMDAVTVVTTTAAESRKKPESGLTVPTAACIGGESAERKSAAFLRNYSYQSSDGSGVDDSSAWDRNTTLSRQLSLSHKMSIYRKGHDSVADVLDSFVYLYAHYIMEASMSTINVSHECRTAIGRLMDALLTDGAHLLQPSGSEETAAVTEQRVHCIEALIPAFDVALAETYRLLSNDAFNRFLMTKEFRQLVSTEQFAHLSTAK